jgi:hypothetical protein
MYIRREALAALGSFDAERFGRGYGEENDFCMRALKAGWRNLLACDVFVYHEGGVSFSQERADLMKAAAGALLALHPDYDERVRAFIERDPVQPARSSVDLARVACGTPEAERVLLERREELTGCTGRINELQRYLESRERHVTELHVALAHATALVEERDEARRALDAAVSRLQEELRQELDRLNGEIQRLRDGLAHAESLAFERQAEIDRMRATWGWRLYSFLARRSPGR